MIEAKQENGSKQEKESIHKENVVIIKSNDLESITTTKDGFLRKLIMINFHEK